MNMLRAVVRELFGLFVDDGALAVGVGAVVLLAALSTVLIPDRPLATGGHLLLGCLGVLLVNVAKAARPKLRRCFSTSALSALPPPARVGQLHMEGELRIAPQRCRKLPPSRPLAGEGGDAQRRRVGGIRELRVRPVATRLPQ